MPPNTHYHQAVLLDPDVAAELSALEKDSKGKGEESFAPPQATWSPELDMQTRIYDRLGALLHVCQAMVLKGSGKNVGEAPKPHPRPKTAMAEARAQKRWAQHEELKSRFLPERPQDGPVD